MAGAAAALTMLLPPVANAFDVTEEDVLVATPDGEADCYFVRPASGSHAGVIVWPDVKGIRPAFRAMGKRLAQSGYAVLVVNPYYRTHEGRILDDEGHRVDGFRADRFGVAEAGTFWPAFKRRFVSKRESLCFPPQRSE